MFRDRGRYKRLPPVYRTKLAACTLTSRWRELFSSGTV